MILCSSVSAIFYPFFLPLGGFPFLLFSFRLFSEFNITCWMSVACWFMICTQNSSVLLSLYGFIEVFLYANCKFPGTHIQLKIKQTRFMNPNGIFFFPFCFSSKQEILSELNSLLCSSLVCQWAREFSFWWSTKCRVTTQWQTSTMLVKRGLSRGQKLTKTRWDRMRKRAILLGGSYQKSPWFPTS